MASDSRLSTKRWAVAAPFFTSDRSRAEWRWIDDFVVGSRHEFVKIAAADAHRHAWHARRSRTTPARQWLEYLAQANASRSGDVDGIVTVFPQLAACAGAQKLVSRRSQPIVAWCFNVGASPPPLMRAFARLAFSTVDRFVVHSRSEIGLLERWFDIPPSKVEFVHLQRAAIPTTCAEDLDRPFILAMGSANRDYVALISAVDGTGIPTVIVAAPRILAGLPAAPNVTLLSDKSTAQCLELAMRARLCVVPLADVETASGQVTVVEAMRLGRPIVATRSAGTIDYISDGETGLLVDQGDPIQLREAILDLWENGQRRDALASAATRFADASLSDEAAALALAKILDSVTDTRSG